MTSARHDDVRDRLEAYALGLLSSDEQAGVRAHVDDCAECTAAVRELLLVVEGIGRAEDPVTPPAHLKARVLDSLAAMPHHRRSAPPARVRADGWTRWALAAAAGLAVVFGGMLFLGRQQQAALESEIARSRTRVDELQQRLGELAGQADLAIAILTAGDMRAVELAPPAGPRTAAARAYWSPTRGLLLAADELPPPPAGRVYQVWLIGPSGASPVSAGVLGDERSRRGMLLVPVPQALGTTAQVTVAITDEPPGGLPAPSGSMRLVGSS